MVRTEKKTPYHRATIADGPALVDCRVRYLNELYNHPENEETKAIRKSLLTYFSKAIPSQDFVAWVAELDGRIVGTSGMVVWEKPALFDVESGKLGYLMNFYSVPDARGKGIATRLLNELIREARLLRLKYLHLHASKDGESIYRKAGFVETEMPGLRLRLE